MEVRAVMSDYSIGPFQIQGNLRASKCGGYCIDVEKDGNRIFPLTAEISKYMILKAICYYSMRGTEKLGGTVL